MIKKLLFAATAFVAISMSANAQEVISFEESEGYSLGDVTGQNEWQTNLVALPDNPNNPTINVVGSLANEGENSLYFEGTNYPYSDTEGNPFYVAALSPIFEVPSSDVFNVSFDIRVTDKLPSADFASDITIYTQSVGENKLTSGLYFSYEGDLGVLESEGWQLAGTYDNETWYTVKISYDFGAGSVYYYLNDNLVFEGTTWSEATTVDNLYFDYDNYGTGFYIDNIKIETDASTENFAKLGLNVFPNPVSDVMNITSPEANIQAVTITDLNGRTVKSINFNNVAETTVDASDLASGVYLMNITANGTVATHKIVKK